MVNKGAVSDELSEFKWKAALMFHKSLPQLSRFFLSKLATGGKAATSNLKIPSDVKCEVCRFCGSFLTLGNTHSRLIKKKNSKTCKKSRKELAKIRRKASSNNRTITMITRCLTCQRITKRLKANKSNQNEPKAKNVLKVESKNPTVQSSFNVQVSIQQSDSSKPGARRSKSKKKKKVNVKQQIQQLLQSQNQNSSGKSRLESFLSSL